MHTITLKLKDAPDMEAYFRDFSKLKRVAFNRLGDGLTPVETVRWIKQNVRTGLDGCFIEWATKEAESLLSANDELGILKTIFGGRKNFEKYNKGKISKEEFTKLRNPNLIAVGRAADLQGNRKFKIDMEKESFFFCPNRNTSFELKFFANAKTMRRLEEMELFAKAHELPLTYRLLRTELHISVDETRLAKPIEKIDGRILGIDLNPNYIGISITDNQPDGSQKEVFSQVFDLKKLNKCLTDKKKYEQLQIAQRIITLCKHYKVETVAVEKLEVEAKNHKKGRVFNKLVNSWDRNTFRNNLQKHCGFLGIRFLEVIAPYSSFVGCLQHPEKIDSVAASLEIARRANLFINIYIKKISQKEPVMFPAWTEALMIRWKDELGSRILTGWKQALMWFKKNPKLCYRILFTDASREVFRMKSRKTNVFLCFA